MKDAEKYRAMEHLVLHWITNCNAGQNSSLVRQNKESKSNINTPESSLGL